jgi:hypothetical protein
MLVAVVVQIVGGLRRLLLHVLILVLVYDLPPSSVSCSPISNIGQKDRPAAAAFAVPAW